MPGLRCPADAALTELNPLAWIGLSSCEIDLAPPPWGPPPPRPTTKRIDELTDLFVACPVQKTKHGYLGDEWAYGGDTLP
jgi:hypothetical protein